MSDYASPSSLPAQSSDAPPKKKGKGCLFYGCLVSGILGVLGVLAIGVLASLPALVLLTPSGDDFNFFHLGVAESGTVYVAIDYFEGGQVSFPKVPYHVISPTERTPLVDVNLEGNADGTPRWENAPVLSRALTAGEEEIILRRYGGEIGGSTIDYQIYKPNFGARFQIIPSEDYNGGNIRNVVISAPWSDSETSPHDPDSSTYTGDYYGGLVAYTIRFEAERREDSFILTPMPLPAP